MKTKNKWCSLVVVSMKLFLFLIFISSTASASTVQNFSSTGPFAYITNYNSNNVSIIDTATNNVTATVNVGEWPFGVAVTPDGTKVYVTTLSTNTIYVIDTSNNTVIATVPVGNSPLGVAVNPDGKKVYVTSSNSPGTVSVIDTTTNTVTATIRLGIGPKGVAVSPDGTKVYVTGNYNPGSVYVIDSATDAATNTVTATVPVGSDPYGVAVNPNGTKIYVANSGSNNLSVIDAITNTVTATVPVGQSPYGVAVNPAGTKVYVTNFRNNSVSVIDTTTNTVITTVSVGVYPRGITVSPDGKKVYVANCGRNSVSEIYTVSVIDTATNKVTDSINVGSGPLSFGQFIGPLLVQPVLPVANFSSNVTTGYAPLFIQFADNSKNATEWNWRFGDGVSSVEQNPVHTYSTAGNYTVTLTANNSAGSNTVTKYSYITVVKPDDTIIEGHAPLSVQFKDLSKGATEWNWNFGDGNTSTEQNPKHTYSKPGQYTVTLTANNMAGSNVITKNSYIIITNSTEAPVADFSVSTTSGKAPLNISFMDNSTGSPGSWNWDFGDGNTSTEQNPMHTYSTAGNYTVTLTVNNSAGSSAVTKYGYIIVTSSLKAPIADFSASTFSAWELPYWITPHPYGSVYDDSTNEWLPTELVDGIGDGLLTESLVPKNSWISEDYTFGIDADKMGTPNPLKLVLLKTIYQSHDHTLNNLTLSIYDGSTWIPIASEMPEYRDVDDCENDNLTTYNITQYVNTATKLEQLKVRFSATGNAANVSEKVGWVDFVGIHVE